MTQPARRIAGAFFAGVLSLTTAALAAGAPARAMAQSPATQPKYAAIVVDANSGEVLYASRADSPRYPASITKVMTLYMAFEALEQGKVKLTDRVVISPRAAAQAPTKSTLRAGESIRLDEAMRLMAVRSYNDLSVAVAEHVGGTESRFAALMTLRAQELGMSQTRFVNSNGLPDSRQISSARDIALLSRAVLRDYPQYYSYFSTREYNYQGRALRNTNGLLHTMPGVDGIKTGFTNASGFNLAASAVRDGRRLIAVVLGGASTHSRNNHVQELLTAGFEVVRRRASGDTVQLTSYLPSSSGARYATVGSTAQGDYTAVQPRTASRSTPVGGGRTYASLGMVVAPEPEVEVAAVARPVAVKRLEPVRSTVRASAKSAPKSDAISIKLATAELSKAERTRTKVEDASKPETGKGDWMVQVGAFRTETDAKDRIGQVARKWSMFRKANAVVAEGGGHYRARFAGFDAEGAKAACKALSGKGEPCMPLRAG
ncbi:MAG: D-alanyl-D-alanine carboxypeptidase [Proteobacteria bacterium]|nr:D-alanyl-D-alanine carboxypeptidase [Pseudomonadota bacterium]MBW3617348.1 D-alanyl-D-alanine carboxypeptidase [Pseudomonadota bacterium]